MSWPIGKHYDGGSVTLKAEHTEAYARATNDENPAYFGPGAIAPPMFHVRLLKDIMFQIASDPELGLDMLRLVHGEHDATFHAPLRPGDEAMLSGRLEEVTQKSSGLLVVSRLFVHRDEELVMEARTSYFIRGMGVDNTASRPTTSKPPTPRAAKEAPPPPDFEICWSVSPDQSHRYAPASLDRNPIHLDSAVAAKAGLPDVILHGLCTMAMAGRSIVDDQAAGDPLRLARLGVRFAKPVFNGQRMTTLGWADGKKFQFIVQNPDGAVVITNGIAEIG